MRLAPDYDLRLSVVQADTRWRDAAANRQMYEALIRPLAGQSDVVVLPETFTSGFGDETVDQAETMTGPSVTWLRELSASTGLVIAGSMVVAEAGRVFNRLFWAKPEGGLQWYDKRHLFRMANEHLRYGQGNRQIYVNCKGWRILLQVCYDLRFPIWSRNCTSPELGHDYDLILYVANWPSPRRYAWQTLLRARAIENLSYVVGVNRVGTDGNGLHYAGDSVILDPLGAPLLELGAQTQTATTTLSADHLRQHRERFPAWQDADGFELLV